MVDGGVYRSEPIAKLRGRVRGIVQRQQQAALDELRETYRLWKEEHVEACDLIDAAGRYLELFP